MLRIRAAECLLHYKPNAELRIGGQCDGLKQENRSWQLSMFRKLEPDFYYLPSHAVETSLILRLINPYFCITFLRQVPAYLTDNLCRYLLYYILIFNTIEIIFPGLTKKPVIKTKVDIFKI